MTNNEPQKVAECDNVEPVVIEWMASLGYKYTDKLADGIKSNHKVFISDEHGCIFANQATFFYRAAHPEPVASPEKREGLCQMCNTEYPVWFAPNDLWNKVMRHADGFDTYNFVCLTCFAKEAEAMGEYPTAWMVTTEDRQKADRQRILDRVEEEVLNSKIRLGGIHGAKTPADIIQATIGTTQALSIEILARIRKEEY